MPFPTGHENSRKFSQQCKIKILVSTLHPTIQNLRIQEFWIRIPIPDPQYRTSQRYASYRTTQEITVINNHIHKTYISIKSGTVSDSLKIITVWYLMEDQCTWHAI
jgi:hypothetical protein